MIYVLHIIEMIIYEIYSMWLSQNEAQIGTIVARNECDKYIKNELMVATDE